MGSLKAIATIVLFLLKLLDKLTDNLQENNFKDEGYDIALGQMTATLLRKSQYAKKIMESVNKLDNAGVDDLLQQLEQTATESSRKSK